MNEPILAAKPPKTFQEGDPAIIFEDITSKKLIFLEKGQKFQNKYGSFSHDQIIGSLPGSKVSSFLFFSKCLRKNGF